MGGEALKVGFALFPVFDADAKSGTLEDLCLSILSDPSSKETLAEIDQFLKLLENRREEPFSHIFKARLHTFFSVHNNYVSLKIGEAAAAGAFDWDNVALKCLAAFLQEVL